MAKNLEISFLLDFYGDMLTDKQRDVVELYYNEDLPWRRSQRTAALPGRAFGIPSSGRRASSWNTRTGCIWRHAFAA